MSSELERNIASVVHKYGVANASGEFLFSIPNLGFLIVSEASAMQGTIPIGSDVSVLLEGDANVTPFKLLQPHIQVSVSDFISDNCYNLGRIGLDSLGGDVELDWIVEPLDVAINAELKLGAVGVYLDRDDEGDINVIGLFDFGGSDVALSAYKDTEEGIAMAKSDIDLWVEKLLELKDKL